MNGGAGTSGEPLIYVWVNYLVFYIHLLMGFFFCKQADDAFSSSLSLSMGKEDMNAISSSSLLMRYFS